MRESENIEHEGFIESIGNQSVSVRIVNESACSSCHAKGACSASDLQDKLIDIVTFDGEKFKKGQKVMIVGHAQQGYTAVLFAYAMPTILIFIALIATWVLTHNDILTAIAGLGILIPYFALISFYRNKLKNTFSFTIKSL